MLLLALPALAGTMHMLMSPASASAAFTRTPLCEAAAEALHDPVGIAAGSEGDAWVSEGGSNTSKGPPAVGKGMIHRFEVGSTCASSGLLDEAGSPVEVEGRTYPLSIAIAQSTGNLYAAGESRENSNGYIEAYDNEQHFLRRSTHRYGTQVHLAVDNSTEPTDLFAGSVYVSHQVDGPEPEGDGMGPGIIRQNAEGAPVGFSAAGKGKGCASYITGGEITGTEEECFVPGHAQPEAVTTDPEGNIYVVVEATNSESQIGVYEYNPTGAFVRDFLGSATGGLRGSKTFGGFGGRPSGVTVDPVSHDVLVAIDGNSEGAIDEFGLDRYPPRPDSRGSQRSQPRMAPRTCC